jgi:hypothetical protein
VCRCGETVPCAETELAGGAVPPCRQTITGLHQAGLTDKSGEHDGRTDKIPVVKALIWGLLQNSVSEMLRLDANDRCTSSEIPLI